MSWARGSLLLVGLAPLQRQPQSKAVIDELEGRWKFTVLILAGDCQIFEAPWRVVDVAFKPMPSLCGHIDGCYLVQCAHLRFIECRQANPIRPRQRECADHAPFTIRSCGPERC